MFYCEFTTGNFFTSRCYGECTEQRSISQVLSKFKPGWVNLDLVGTLPGGTNQGMADIPGFGLFEKGSISVVSCEVAGVSAGYITE